jgi:hypothetical protein
MLDTKPLSQRILDSIVPHGTGCKKSR